MEKSRCFWANTQNELYVKYHDEEWGVPVYDDNKLFEMLILEGFQAGLSWECVLNKREAFREAFDGFDPFAIAGYSEEKINELMNNSKIIRNRLKINGAVKNAGIFIEIQREFGGFYNYLRKLAGENLIFETGKTTSPLSDLISNDLKKRGMKFVGSTIIYSYLQATGFINGHEEDCYLYKSFKNNV
ncbi:MAG: DNA-3-methyladenine glycosylase I [Clostridiales bacterium]|nr:DNA-3-methyladenine glycosylase I [Clostridiales bacterium]